MNTLTITLIAVYAVGFIIAANIKNVIVDENEMHGARFVLSCMFAGAFWPFFAFFIMLLLPSEVYLDAKKKKKASPK